MGEPPLIAVATIRPPRGEPKRRYGVVYTSDNMIAVSARIDLVGISTSCYQDDPDKIPLPWSQDGRCMTRLRAPCDLVLTMTDSVLKEDVTATWGYVPRSVLADSSMD